MFHIEFVGMLCEGSPPEVLDRMTTDIAESPACGDPRQVALRECHYSAGP